MGNIKIRKVEDRDIEKILYLEEKFPPRSREMITKDKMKELILRNSEACLVAEENYKIVGAIFGEPRRDGCKIISLIIDLDNINEDASSKLIKELLERTRSKNIIK